MASMDLDTIIRDLNERFAAPLPEFYERRIIFWHDEDGEFADELDEISLENAKLLVLTGNNNFVAKKLLTVDDTASNYLVYSPLSYASPGENWLLNIELYSEEFRADLVSIWMEEMGLSATPDFRRLVKSYKKFFAAQARRAAFAKLNRGIRRPSQLHLAVMAAICGTGRAQPNDIVRAVLAGGTNEESNAVFQSFVHYGAEDAFWALVRQAAGYAAGEDPSLEKLAAHILLTATTRTLRAEYLAGLDDFISTPHQSWCYEFVSEWMAIDKEALSGILREMEEAFSLRERFRKVPLKDLVDTEIFPCVDVCILRELMEEINDHVIRTEVIADTVERRRTLAWYDEVACYYEGILQVAKMQAFFLEHAEGFHTVEARKVWKAYTEDYYRMDRCYRRYHLAFGRSLTAGNDDLDDLFKQVTDAVEGLYTHWFLGELGRNWSDACADELAQYGRILEVAQQVNFYNDNVESTCKRQRVFVIISDALRYEVAASLAEELRFETQSEVRLTSCAAVFPTVTKFGMAALLPHKKLSVSERGAGDLQVLADGMSTDAASRDKVLKATNRNSVALKYRDLAPMKRTERSALVKGMDVVYIYHDKIDAASHTSSGAVFPACEAAVEEIKNIVRIIRNEFGGTRVYITADHGFLYTYSPLSEDAKVDKTTPSAQDVEIDRRYLITRKGATPDFLLPVKFMDDRYDAFSPRESVRIKKKGGGLNFVHGGISLQEMVVPVIDYHYLRSDSKTYLRNKDAYDTKPVEVGLLSASRKVSNRAFSLNFYQKTAVGANRSAANYLVYFVDADGEPISDTARIIADKASDNGQERIFRCNFNLKARKYDNRESYYLVIAEESGVKMPQKEEFQIDIASAVDEFDFFS